MGIEFLLAKIPLRNGRYSSKQFVNCTLFGCAKALWIPLYKWGSIVKSFEKFSNSLPFLCLFGGYQLRIYIVVNLCVSSTLLSYISRLESRSKLPPVKEKNGFRLAARRCDVKRGFSQTIDACRASVTLSKHCLCHYNGAWLAFVSFTLSKHWICNDKPFCTSVHHSQQALLLDAHPSTCSCLRLLASIGFGHPKPTCLGVRQS